MGVFASSSRSLRFSASSAAYTSPERASPVGWGGAATTMCPTPSSCRVGSRSKPPSLPHSGMGAGGLRTSSDPPLQTIIPWCQKGMATSKDQQLYMGPARGSPSPLAPTRRLLSGPACPRELLLQHSLHCLDHLRERPEPAQHKSVVTITSPQPLWSWDQVALMEGWDGSEGPVCSTDPCGPQPALFA